MAIELIEVPKEFTDVDGKQHATGRFDTVHGYAGIKLQDGTELKVFDTHAESLWFATAKEAPADAYPKETDRAGGKIKLCPLSTRLVPPKSKTGTILAHQSPIYRILEEEKIAGPDGEETAAGYITTGTMQAMDYLEHLGEDVASGGGGNLFDKVSVGGSSVVEAAALSERKVIQIMNKRGVSQLIASNYVASSKMKDALKSWAEHGNKNSFGETNLVTFQFKFTNVGQSNYRLEDADEGDILCTGDPVANLGLTFGEEDPGDCGGANHVKKVKTPSAAASVGIEDSKPFYELVGHLKGKRPLNAKEQDLAKTMSFREIKYARNQQEEDLPMDNWSKLPFSPNALRQLLMRKEAKTVALVRNPLANGDAVYKAIDAKAAFYRQENIGKMQATADRDQWFVHVENLPTKAWPVAENDTKIDSARFPCGPFPADWPGYHMEDDDGNPIAWDPDKHDEPVDEDFYAREFVKTYSYVKARGSMKGPSGGSGDKWAGLSVLYAALYGYETQGKKGEDVYDLFPDRNESMRKAYQLGIAVQIPQCWTQFYAEMSAPELKAERQFKAMLLRAAYFQGFNHSTKKTEEMIPSAWALREAYKAGKRAVAIGISQDDWQHRAEEHESAADGRFKLSTFKRLACPVEYRFVGRKDEDDQPALASKNWFLRQVWEKAADEAWELRKSGSLCTVSAKARVPDEDRDDKTWVPLQDAFTRGATARKQYEFYCAPDSNCQCNLIIQTPTTPDQLTNSLDMYKNSLDGSFADNGLGVTGTVDDKAGPGQGHIQNDPQVPPPGTDESALPPDQRGMSLAACKLAFIDGLNAAQAANVSGTDAKYKAPAKPDKLYPYTLEDLKKAYKDGVDMRTVDEKKKILSVPEEAQPEEDCMDFIYEHLGGCYNACCPMCVEGMEGDKKVTFCLGTSYGDWVCILCCFAFWYTFCGMYYWALIEIMFCVAEPQRPF